MATPITINSQYSVNKLYNSVIKCVMSSLKYTWLDHGLPEEWRQEVKRVWKKKLAATGAVTDFPPPTPEELMFQNEDIDIGFAMFPHPGLDEEFEEEEEEENADNDDNNNNNDDGVVNRNRNLPNFSLANGHGDEEDFEDDIETEVSEDDDDDESDEMDDIAIPQFDGGIDSADSDDDDDQKENENMEDSDFEDTKCNGFVLDEGQELLDIKDEIMDDQDSDEGLLNIEDKELEEMTREMKIELEAYHEEIRILKNVIICQYEKVFRKRNQWKFVLREGVMHVKGKDYVFGKAKGGTITLTSITA